MTTTTNASSIVNAKLREFIASEIRDCQQQLEYCKSIVNDKKSLDAEGVTEAQVRYLIESFKQQVAAWNEKLDA